MAEEAAFLGLSEDDLMDTDAQPLGIPNADVAEPQPKAPATPRPAPPPPLNSAEQGHSVQLTPRTPAAPPASSTSPAPPPLVQVTASPPLRAEPTGPSKTALTVPPAGTADVSMSVDGADTATPAGGSGPPHQDGRSESTAKTDKQRKASVDSDNEQDVGTEALDGGLKSTPAGDVPLPMKRSPKSKDPYPPRTASKKATEMFQSVARQADLMSTRVPGWAFCMFVPMERKGEMRSWSSPQVRSLVPDLPGLLRQTIFDHLEPFREQVDDERELIIKQKDEQLKETETELERYKRMAEDAERRAHEKEREAKELRHAYASAQEFVK
ncbi:hypothetical protein AURDEDRAFT_166021 [Auricularia subglabra TFB-10046 SS5]|nr:hypothetical protein AURDEDRAFT_166021 [Auricularia subglabra TFB-10046 SS5]